MGQNLVWRHISSFYPQSDTLKVASVMTSAKISKHSIENLLGIGDTSIMEEDQDVIKSRLNIVQKRKRKIKGNDKGKSSETSEEQKKNQLIV